MIHTSKAYTSNCIKINDEMSSFMKKVLESANMTNEGKWPIHQLQKVTTCLESRTKFD
ncbi:hypothetical protein ALT1545_280063 [Alteromonas macleodii]